ncbi:glycoside hydrolase family 5 protein [Ruminococcus sp. Marseille-P6503]|uniref:glycoside hydrolase family 5 protein n=1 Tax=Ruminococcus sp. Marseille-P6503 TaxID=2364796 RepID=UPI000F52B75D|nr:glycoside hydrolase family 5 protein [Ruminococcus sp. Marseille-P6503]
MIRKSKLAAFILCAAVACSAFSGCGKDGDSSSGGNAKGSGAEEMRDISSMELVKEMTLGWNLGNSLDVCNADRDGDGQIDENAEVVDETLWGNVKTTKEMFEALKEDGFNSVRIPVTWRDHLSDDYTIDADWMDRVQEVVDYAYDLDMYVIINLHHDGGGDPQFGAWIRNASTDYDGVLAKYKTIWTQICERFENYDERLIFESMNEVGFDDMGKDDAYTTLNNLNQEFVDLVRASGGNNPQRHLLIAGYWTDVEMTCDSRYKMPDDPAGRCIVSVHYYTPWEFCTTNINYEWGSEQEVSVMESKVNDMAENYVSKGIPVIIGEFGTGVWNEKESGVYFSEMFTKLCHENGIAPFMWDDGAQFNRETYEWNYPELVEAMNRAVSGEDYEVVKG